MSHREFGDSCSVLAWAIRHVDAVAARSFNIYRVDPCACANDQVEIGAVLEDLRPNHGGPHHQDSRPFERLWQLFRREVGLIVDVHAKHDQLLERAKEQLVGNEQTHDARSLPLA